MVQKIKYKIVAEHKDKGIIEIPISKNLLHSISDILFIMESCERCNETFKLNKIDKDVKKFFNIFLFLSYDVDGDGCAYEMLERKNKTDKIKFKKIKSDFILIKKPRWKK